MRKVYEPGPISQRFLQTTVEEMQLARPEAQDLLMGLWMHC